MKGRLILVAGVLIVVLLSGCGGDGGTNLIDIYVGTWQGLIPDYGFEWRLVLGDGGTDLDNNPRYSYEVWDLEPGVEFMWGAGYAVAYPTGLVEFTAYHPNTGTPTFRFTAHISGNTMSGSMWNFMGQNSSDFVFTRR